MRLNGWQRLWALAAALWAAACIGGFVYISTADVLGPFLWMRVRWTLIAWLIPCALLYALGWLLGRAWGWATNH